MRIGVDIDGVLYQWEKTARYMLREVLPNSPYKAKPHMLHEPSTHWGYIEGAIEPRHWQWLWTHGVARGLFRHGHLYPGVIEAMERLSMLGKVIIVTHRPASAVNDTLAWLAYQQFEIDGVHILTNGETKASVKDLSWFVDDKPENIADMLGNGYTRCVLMNRMWNRRPSCFNPHEYNRVYDVDSLGDFASLVAHGGR